MIFLFFIGIFHRSWQTFVGNDREKLYSFFCCIFHDDNMQLIKDNNFIGISSFICLLSSLFIIWREFCFPIKKEIKITRGVFEISQEERTFFRLRQSFSTSLISVIFSSFISFQSCFSGFLSKINFMKIKLYCPSPNKNFSRIINFCTNR